MQTFLYHIFAYNVYLKSYIYKNLMVSPQPMYRINFFIFTLPNVFLNSMSPTLVLTSLAMSLVKKSPYVFF